jgi:glyoxylase-like metal-dependent hydrolase (beta-lactamase superfamily II)
MTRAPAAARPERPPDGGTTEIAPGLLWVRMPLPYALDHVNLWLLAEGDGWTLIDTGHGDPATRAAWDALAGTVLRGRPIRRVICTHHHPDHLGLAGWMAERWGAELWCTRAEWLEARVRTVRKLGEARAVARAFFLRAGIPGTELPALLERCNSYPDNVSPMPLSYRRLKDGDELSAGGLRWRVVVGRGHAPEHACLLAPAAGVLVSGDQLLPSISPNVSVWPHEPDEDPLADFLSSLVTLDALPPHTLVLPSHGAPFRGLHRRCAALARHHRERLDTVLAACDRPRTAFEVMTALFERALDPHQTTFAIGEAIAHLNRLVALGLVRRARPGQGPDRYVRAVHDVPGAVRSQG